MKKKFSNKPKPPKGFSDPRAKRKKDKKQAKPESEIKSIPVVEHKNKRTLYLISSDSANFKTNMQSSIDTWINTISTDDDHLFLCDKEIKGVNCIYNPKSDYTNHSAYSADNLKWFLTQKLLTLPTGYERVCFCTETTYLNTLNIFKSVTYPGHWGCVSNLLYHSIEELKKIAPDIDANSMRMYHAEAGFVLNMETIKKIIKRIEYNSGEILSDRWDSLIAHVMHLLKLELNDDDKFFTFPHTMLNLNKEEIKESKSHGYLKYYEKKAIHDILIGK